MCFAWFALFLQYDLSYYNTMNNIKLNIKRLGPVADTEIRMAPFMIFTGSSNLGKSYVNFLTYYVMSVFSGNRIAGFLRSKISDKTAEKKEFTFSFTLNEICKWMEQDVKLFFQYLLNYPNVPCEVSFEFETEIKDFKVRINELDRLEGIYGGEMPIIVTKINEEQIFSLKDSKDIINCISNPISKVLSGIILEKKRRYTFLLPPGRASLLNESYSRQAESSKVGMYDIFLRDFDRINNMRNRSVHSKSNKKVDSLINGVLNSTKDGLFLKLNDNTEIPLSAAASSIKELSPFVLWMQTVGFQYDSMCIEEPEAHAHPEMQYGIADLLAKCVNKGAFIQMTTHSDYLLARLNQLIKLFDLKKKNSELYRNISGRLDIDKELPLDKSKIRAYYFSVDKDNYGVKVEEQDVTDGIPFSTFMNAVKMQMDWDNLYEGDTDYGNL